MPLAGRDKTFGLENCRDLLNKLEREIDRYKVASDKDEILTMMDTAFNISVTAWHLCDWVFADMTKAQRERLDIANVEDMRHHALTCRAVCMLRQAATASKHWEVTRYSDERVKVVVAAKPQWDISFHDGGAVHDAIDVFEEALTFWTQLIYPNQIAS